MEGRISASLTMFWHRACWFRAGAQAHIRARNLCMRTKSLEVRSQSACIAFKRTVGSVLCELSGPRIRNQRKCIAATPARRLASLSRARARAHSLTRARTHVSPHANTRAPAHARTCAPAVGTDDRCARPRARHQLKQRPSPSRAAAGNPTAAGPLRRSGRGAGVWLELQACTASAFAGANACARARTNARARASAHKCTRTQMHASTHTHTRTYTQAHTQAHTGTHTHAHARTLIGTHARSTRARIHTQARTHVHARTLARQHTHAHTHRRARTYRLASMRGPGLTAA